MVNLRKIKGWLFLSFVILSLVLVAFAGFLNYTTEDIQNLMMGYRNLALFIYIVLIAIAAATTLPISAVLAAGIFIFSFFEAVLLAFIGIIAGALFIFYLSRKTGYDSFKYYANLKHEKLKALRELLKENAFNIVMLFNFVYFFPSNLAYIVAGITGMKMRKFLFAAIIGNFPNFIAFAMLIYGSYYQNYYLVTIAIIVLVLASGIPLYVYRRHMKDIVVLAFSYKAYKRMKRAEKFVEKEARLK